MPPSSAAKRLEDDHEDRITRLEAEVLEIKETIDKNQVESMGKLDRVLRLLGEEPRPIENVPGSGVLGKLSDVLAEQTEKQRTKERFWRGIAAFASLLGLISTLIALWPRLSVVFGGK